MYLSKQRNQFFSPMCDIGVMHMLIHPAQVIYSRPDQEVFQPAHTNVIHHPIIELQCSSYRRSFEIAMTPARRWLASDIFRQIICKLYRSKTIALTAIPVQNQLSTLYILCREFCGAGQCTQGCRRQLLIINRDEAAATVYFALIPLMGMQPELNRRFAKNP
jgi:hypothetical protein